MCWKANGIDAKGQCGKNWPSSCNRSMCLMCSDIILVEINYLGQSEGVSREIPMARHELSSDTSSAFSVCLGFFFNSCSICESSTRPEYPVFSCS